jgi:hypothetical protein
VSHQSDKQELSTRESKGASHISFSEANPKPYPSTGFTGKNTRTQEQPLLFNLLTHHSTESSPTRSPGGAGQVNQPQDHHRSKTSTSTNHLGAGVRYKQDQPEQNSVLLINKHVHNIYTSQRVWLPCVHHHLVIKPFDAGKKGIKPEEIIPGKKWSNPLY